MHRVSSILAGAAFRSAVLLLLLFLAVFLVAGVVIVSQTSSEAESEIRALVSNEFELFREAAETGDMNQLRQLVDSSAAAIAAQGLLRLAHVLRERGEAASADRYQAAGLTVLKTLLNEPYLSTDREHEGLLLHTVYHRPRGWDSGRPWGSQRSHSASRTWASIFSTAGSRNRSPGCASRDMSALAGPFFAAPSRRSGSARRSSQKSEDQQDNDWPHRSHAEQPEAVGDRRASGKHRTDTQSQRQHDRAAQHAGGDAAGIVSKWR